MNRFKLRKYLNIVLPLFVMVPYVGYVLNNRFETHHIKKEEIIAKRKEKKEQQQQG